MKLLFLSKRRPQGKDLLTRPYGRFFHIPRILAKRGHEVTLLLLSYRKEPRLRLKNESLTWISESLYPAGPYLYVARAKRLVEQVKPDWIVGLSDTYYGILAVMLARKYGIFSVVDAYDNYESYISWLKPLHQLWRKALSKATVVTAAGPHLADYLRRFRPEKQVHVVPMAADPQGFSPIEKEPCRHRLQLPLQKKIIGYCGAIHKNRGLDLIFPAFEGLTREDTSLELVLTGRKRKGLRLPRSSRWLGYLPDEEMPFLLNSLDVLLVPNRLSDFGRFSYPVKLYEAMSCQLPVVATDTRPAHWILKGRSQFLARPESEEDLVQKTRSALNIGRFDYGVQNTWEDSALAFEKALILHP
jgi:glycosyltransferase involved in cell wall biosynthesis